jgi:hypothetical protein
VLGADFPCPAVFNVDFEFVDSVILRWCNQRQKPRNEQQAENQCATPSWHLPFAAYSVTHGIGRTDLPEKSRTPGNRRITPGPMSTHTHEAQGAGSGPYSLRRFGFLPQAASFGNFSRHTGQSGSRRDMAGLVSSVGWASSIRIASKTGL